MVTPGLSQGLFAGYVLVFAVAALACFVSVARTRYVEDRDARVGLVALLLTSGAWSVSHVVFLVAPTPSLKLGAYYVGLIVGISTVGPWLYFCSAYTGRSLHRNPALRWIAVALFVGIVAVKVTNPIHGQYFTAQAASSPFPHLAIDLGPLHWLAMGLAYALATVGYFMLLELFLRIDYDTRPLAALVGITALPLALALFSNYTPYLLEITYEPLGVAAFAVGVSFAYVDRFQTVETTRDRDGPTIVLSDEDRIRAFNDEAGEVFPDRLTDDAVGEFIHDVLPELGAALDGDHSIVGVKREGDTRYYRVTTNPFGAGDTSLGELVLLSDITHRERYRRELERQNDRLEQFASMVSHDLRNPLTISKGNVEALQMEMDDERLDSIATANDRMAAMIDDLLALARQGQPIDETETVYLSTVAREAWGLVDTGDAAFELDGDGTVEADDDRLQQLFENLFRNAMDHGGTVGSVTVGTLPEGFYVADDGRGIPESEREDIFESGFTTDEEGTGFGLAIVSEIVDAHDWRIEATESGDGGARFEVTNVDVDHDDSSVSREQGSATQAEASR